MVSFNNVYMTFIHMYRKKLVMGPDKPVILGQHCFEFVSSHQQGIRICTMYTYIYMYIHVTMHAFVHVHCKSKKGKANGGTQGRELISNKKAELP